MNIILLERVGKLGQMGDVVKVKDGYARNFLLPQGKALRANKANKAVFEAQRAELEKRNDERKNEAQGAAGSVSGQSFVVIRTAGDSGQLYGSVSTRDIAALVAESTGTAVTRNNIILAIPIKTLGLHEVMVSLHSEVEVPIILNVARSEDEAERQARGEDVTQEQMDDEDDDAIAPEEVFEDESLAEEAIEDLNETEEEAAEAPAPEAESADEGENGEENKAG